MEKMQIRIMRYMAWERAKGELRSMLETHVFGENEKREELEKAIEEFIGDIEGTGKHE